MAVEVFEHFFEMNKVQIALNGDELFSPENQQKLDAVLHLLKSGTPIQYLKGSANFLGLDFFVDNRVLIPRPETEELVQWIIDDNLDVKGLKVLDIGTGSGCIAITLAARLNGAIVQACEVSQKALEVAAFNAQSNGVEVGFLKLDILTEELPHNGVDIIVSNPPYVLDKEKAQMKKNVLDYEPHCALFVPDSNPLLFYKAIAAKAFKALKPNGRLYLEINENLGIETVNCLHMAGFTDVVLRNDLRGKDRMVKGWIT